MRLEGTYAGTVESIRDPEKLGRVKVRVAHVHGVSTGGAGYIGTTDLPWALPAGMPAGGSKASGGFSQLPFIGDHVWVRFLDGEPEKPIWEWGMQTYTDRDAQKLHVYEDNPDGTVGNPKASVWTRYAHAFEINASSVIVTTSKGYGLQFVDGQPSDGTVRLYTQRQNFFELSDLDDGATLFLNWDFNVQVGETVSGYSNAFEWTTLTGGFRVASGASAEITSIDGTRITATGPIEVDSLETLGLSAPRVSLGVQGAVEPIVLGLRLTTWIEAMLLYLATHTHSNGNMGSPTGVPLVPPQASAPPTATLLSATVYAV